MISLEQQEDVVRLYKEQKHTIKEIIKLTGVRSEQTIYRILDGWEIPRLKIRKPARKITITIDEDVDELLRKEKPKNISKWANEMIKRGYFNR